MRRNFILGGLVAAIALGIWAVSSGAAFQLANSTATSTTRGTEQVAWECNGDAKLCPDGSSVGRTGPQCEFRACPSADATFARVETYLGGRDGGLYLTINPREVVSDSRCPKDVQCVWAGTVEVRAAVETKVAHGEHIFKLGEPITVGDLSVTLVEVRPSTAEEAKNPENSYWFVFELRKQ
jgi:hypothetical protein